MSRMFSRFSCCCCHFGHIARSSDPLYIHRYSAYIVPGVQGSHKHYSTARQSTKMFRFWDKAQRAALRGPASTVRGSGLEVRGSRPENRAVH